MEELIKKDIENILRDLLKDDDEKIQMFDCRDCMGDYKITLYQKNGVEVLYTPGEC